MTTSANSSDEWKLPADAYNEAIKCLEDEGIDTGRGKTKKDKADKPVKISVPFDVVSDEILKLFHIFTMRDTKQIYIYNNGVYKSEGADTILETHIRTIHDDMYKKYWGWINSSFELSHIPKATNAYITEALAYIRSYTHIPRKEIDDAAGSYINLKNGLFNLSEWKFEEHNPRYLSISQSPVNYDANATCPNISKFLTEVARPEDIDFLLEWVGYCLTLDVEHQKAVLLYGPPGTGKSVYLSLLEAIVGEESRTCQPLQKIESDKYRCAQLYGKKVNICSDIPDTKMHQSNIFKALTSGIDTIDGENKFQAPFSFRNTAKLTFSANKIPEGPKDEAYYQRWILIEFAHRFRGTVKEVKGIINSLTTDQELSGLLCLALDGLKQVKDTSVFSYSKTFAEIEKEYLINSNPSMAFMDECIVMSTDDLDATILYATFVEWCRTHNTELVSKIGFSRKISEMGYTSHRENVTKDGSKKVIMWDNISLRERPFGQDEEDFGQDKKKSSCPKISSQPSLVRRPETVFGQDDFSFVGNKKEKNVNEYKNIETVRVDKSDDFFTATAMSESSCPRERFFDSGEYGQDENKHLVLSCPNAPKAQSSIGNEESYSAEILTTSELLRRDLKNYARSEYNSVVENVPVFVGEFNKKFPGFVNSLGLQAILGNAERLNARGWK
jgi:putative DNA primase/helicase